MPEDAGCGLVRDGCHDRLGSRALAALGAKPLASGRMPKIKNLEPSSPPFSLKVSSQFRNSKPTAVQAKASDRGLARHAGSLHRLLVTPRRSVARLRLEAISHCQHVTTKRFAAVVLAMARPAIVCLTEGFSPTPVQPMDVQS